MPMITRRSIFYISGSYGITLPKGWVEYWGLKPKDKVTLIANKDIKIVANVKGIKKRFSHGK